jgi:hypothetical protein
VKKTEIGRRTFLTTGAVVLPAMALAAGAPNPGLGASRTAYGERSPFEKSMVNTFAAAHKQDFHATLAAPGRSLEIPESADAYGWLIGSWELDVLYYAGVDVAALRIKGEAHFGWVLEGRAVQDVWIMPRGSDRTAELDKSNNMYGTTLRVWDASIQAWRITWINPVTGYRAEQTGRWSGKDVVQVGAYPNGTPTRWSFKEITPESFHWTGEALQADGKTWRMEGEFRAKRIR